MCFPRRLQFLGLVAAVLVLSSCSLIEPKPAKVYQLTEAAGTPSYRHLLPVSLRVQTPVASSRLSSARIAVVKNEKEMQVYKGVRWSSPVPRLLSDYLVDGLRHDGRINHISRDSGIKADYALSSQVTAFQSEVDSGEQPKAHIRLYLQLVDVRHQKILNGRYFNVSVKATTSEVDSVVAAFSLASQKLTKDVSNWTYSQISASRRKSQSTVDDVPGETGAADDSQPTWEDNRLRGHSIVF